MEALRFLFFLVITCVTGFFLGAGLVNHHIIPPLTIMQESIGVNDIYIPKDGYKTQILSKDEIKDMKFIGKDTAADAVSTLSPRK